MNKLLAALLGCALLTVGGCASTSSQPDWVNCNPNKYPAEQYLIGRGQAATAEEARDRARADLAKIFEVSVAVESQDVQTFSLKPPSAGKESKPAGEYSAQASRSITTRADQIIQGIQIADVWQDAVAKTHHALAVLPRLQAATRLRQEIERLDGATRKYLEESRGATDLLLKVGAADRALGAQLERAGYQKSLRIVDPTGRGAEPEWNTAKLDADLAELLKRVPKLSLELLTAPTKPLAAQLVERRLDLVVAPRFEDEHPSLVAEPLIESDIVVVAHPEHPYCTSAPASIEEILRHPIARRSPSGTTSM